MTIHDYIKQHQLTPPVTSGVNPPAIPHNLTEGFDNPARATIYTNSDQTTWAAISQDFERFALITPKVERFTGFCTEHYPTLTA